MKNWRVFDADRGALGLELRLGLWFGLSLVGSYGVDGYDIRQARLWCPPNHQGNMPGGHETIRRACLMDTKPLGVYAWGMPGRHDTITGPPHEP